MPDAPIYRTTMYPAVESDSPPTSSPESFMQSDPDTREPEAGSPASTFVPASDRSVEARLPAVLDLFVSWVVRDGKGWVRRL